MDFLRSHQLSEADDAVGHGDLFSETKARVEDEWRMGSEGGGRVFLFRFIPGVPWGFPGGAPSA
jgi:hypothetical protein